MTPKFKRYLCEDWSPAWSGRHCKAAQWDGIKGSIGKALTEADINGGEDINTLGVPRVMLFAPNSPFNDFCTMKKDDWIIITNGDRHIQTWEKETFLQAWHLIDSNLIE